MCDLVWSDPDERCGWGISPRGAGYTFGQVSAQHYALCLMCVFVCFCMCVCVMCVCRLSPSARHLAHLLSSLTMVQSIVYLMLDIYCAVL